MHLYDRDIRSACEARLPSDGFDTVSNCNISPPDEVDNEFADLMFEDCLVSHNLSGPSYTTQVNTSSVYFDFMTLDSDIVEYRFSVVTDGGVHGCEYSFGGDGGGIAAILIPTCAIDAQPMACARSDPIIIEPPDIDPNAPLVDLIIPPGLLRPQTLYRIRLRTIKTNDCGCFSPCVAARVYPDPPVNHECETPRLLTRTETFGNVPDIFSETRYPTLQPTPQPTNTAFPTRLPTLQPTASPVPGNCSTFTPNNVTGVCGGVAACGGCTCACYSALDDAYFGACATNATQLCPNATAFNTSSPILPVCRCLQDGFAVGAYFTVNNPTLIACNNASLPANPMLQQLIALIVVFFGISPQNVIISNAVCGSYRFRLTIVDSEAALLMQHIIVAWNLTSHDDVLESALRDPSTLIKDSTTLVEPGSPFQTFYPANIPRCALYTDPFPVSSMDVNTNMIPDPCDSMPLSSQIVDDFLLVNQPAGGTFSPPRSPTPPPSPPSPQDRCVGATSGSCCHSMNLRSACSSLPAENASALNCCQSVCQWRPSCCTLRWSTVCAARARTLAACNYCAGPPTERPTSRPSANPTRLPTRPPIVNPTRLPTQPPSVNPTRLPTENPTRVPTNQPTERPTSVPTPPTPPPTPGPTEICPLIGRCSASSGDAYSVCARRGECPAGSVPDSNLTVGESCLGDSDPLQQQCSCCQRSCGSAWLSSPCASDDADGDWKTCVPRGTCVSRFRGFISSLSCGAGQCECCSLLNTPPATSPTPPEQFINQCNNGNSDNIATGFEACDGADLRGQTCTSLGFAGGTLRCTEWCDTFDASACLPYGACCRSSGGAACTPYATASTCSGTGATFVANAPVCTPNLCAAATSTTRSAAVPSALQPAGTAIEAGTQTIGSASMIANSEGGIASQCVGCFLGSFGGILQAGNGSMYAVSNAHVWASLASRSAEDNCARPRPPVRGTLVAHSTSCSVTTSSSSRPIGRLTAFSHLTPGSEQRFDAALALITPGVGSPWPLQMGIGWPAQGPPVSPTLGMVVVKSSRTTGFTIGSIVGVDVTAYVSGSNDDGSGGNYVITYVSQLLVWGISPSAVFSQAGDSGSMVFQQSTMRGVGLLFAGSSSGRALVSPLQPVIDAFFPDGGGIVAGLSPSARKRHVDASHALPGENGDRRFVPHMREESDPRTTPPSRASVGRVCVGALRSLRSHRTLSELIANRTMVMNFVGYSPDAPNVPRMVVVVSNAAAAAETRRTLPAMIDGAPVEVQVGEQMKFH